ncbi:MAG: Hsp70 family protein [Alphaproteobacteria bacterium]|nr:Hsp70 family protein [Alphaproteobacteria bacterium]
MYCGIDFGTSNSAIAVATSGSVTLAPVEGQSTTLPSAIFFKAEKNIPLFGRQAIKAYADGDDGRFMRGLKRILGTSLMGNGTHVNGRFLTFDAIIGDFIRHLKTNTEAHCQASLDHVVMGRPVNFIDHNPDANFKAQGELEAIAKAVGFKHVEFQYEPIAAAFAHERTLTKEQLALVVDIGGGTSDFTVISLSPDSLHKIDRTQDILANTGVRVGGNDLDKDLCLTSFMPLMGYQSTYGDKNLSVPVGPFHDMSEWSKVNFLYVPRVRSQVREIHKTSHDKDKFGRFLTMIEQELGHRLLSCVEEAKVQLTLRMTENINLNFIEDALGLDITRDEFNGAIIKHLDKISVSIAECLKLAQTDAKQIQMVILTGGTTEVPLLKDVINQTFPLATMSEENKLSSVGIGLGYDSARRFG